MINNISDGKILHYLDRVVGDKTPIVADVFLTNFCNNKCPYCTYGRWDLSNGASYMKYEDFVLYASRMVELGVEGIILTGGGEPTLSPDFDKITKWLDDNNIHYGINTNFNVYKEFNPDYLKVSLDAWDTDSYKKIRGVDAYEKVRDNIKRYGEFKSSKTKLGIQLLAKSVSDVYSFYNNNRDLPVDYISIRPMESTLGSYYHNLPEIELDLQPYNIIGAIKQLRSIDNRIILNYKWELLDTYQNDCTAQWAQLAVNERGDVMYCCHKPYEIVGHILDEDILDKKAKATTDMRMCDIPCRMTAPNREIANIITEKEDCCFL